MIADNLNRVEAAIQAACDKAHRDRSEVTLVAVTKTVDLAATKTLVQLGVTNIAENRGDKFLDKKQQMADFPDISWHFIGNLQRRKVKSIVTEIDYFHALDNLKLAAEIHQRRQEVLKCFVEVNVSQEASKQGLPLGELTQFIEALAAYDRIEVVGLMTMAPLVSTEAQQREIFAQLREAQQQIAAMKLPYAPCHSLSMGMSNDFQAAILEGATHIRVGTALFADKE